MDGWIKLYRKMIDWDWWTDSYVVHVFVYLLLMANHKARKFGNRTIKQGQFLTSIRAISRDLNLNERTVMRALKTLYESNTISVVSDRQNGTLITICKYNEYQSIEQNAVVLDTTPNTTPNTTRDTTRDTTKQELKNDKNVKNNSICRFTPPTLEQVVEYCKERKNNVDAQRWFNYYTANGWKVGKNSMKDWRAAVRTWENATRTSQPAPAPKSMQNAYVNDRWKR